MRSISEPTIRLIGRPTVDDAAIAGYLDAEGVTWETDAPGDAERLAEFAGRMCYLSFGAAQGRKTNAAYLANILEQAHGSVLEHAVWNFLITGVSRSLTHELVRHRAGVAVSQLSQRYVDESQARYVEPAIIAADPEAHALWLNAVATAQTAYRRLGDRLDTLLASAGALSRRERRKRAREAARSVLPNATETQLVFSANTRALRHIIELRGGAGADAEIRRFAVALARLMRAEAPNLFGDMAIVLLPDGSESVQAQYHKV